MPYQISPEASDPFSSAWKSWSGKPETVLATIRYLLSCFHLSSWPRPPQERIMHNLSASGLHRHVGVATSVGWDYTLFSHSILQSQNVSLQVTLATLSSFSRFIEGRAHEEPPEQLQLNLQQSPAPCLLPLQLPREMPQPSRCLISTCMYMSSSTSP